jgi:hypothetical protein
MYKAPDGSNYGTKNLLDHVRACRDQPKGQMSLHQCLNQTPQLSKHDLARLKRKQVEYVVNGFHSFRSVENPGLINLLQTCVDFGAKYGKIDIKRSLTKRNSVSRETSVMSSQVKERLKDILQQPVIDGTVSVSLDMYTDDYRKFAYLDVHSCWITQDFETRHALLAVRHFGTEAHTGSNIEKAVSQIMTEYGLKIEDTPATTDHGANVVAALKNSVRLDCLCHRLHTVMEGAWRETKEGDRDALTYENAISDLCRFAKQATGIQEQLTTSLKHGGNTRPWLAMYRRAESVEKSYESLVKVLTDKSRLELIANVSRVLNKEIMEITFSVKGVFESLEKINEPTLQLVAPSYYLLAQKFAANPRDSKVMKIFRSNLLKCLDEKYWSSVTALHWTACFLDPSFKQLNFVPSDDVIFKRNLKKDIDEWVMTEMKSAAQRLSARAQQAEQARSNTGETSTAAR